MGMDPISIAMLATTAYQGYQSYEAGKESQAAYNESAAEITRQTAYQQRMALEEMKEVGREGRSAESQAVAAAGKSGLRVAGSVTTLTQAIAQKVERRKAMISFQFGEEARRGAFEVDRLRGMGRAAKKAGGIEAFGSLLTGGLQVAKRKEGLGTNWRGLFDKTYRNQQAGI
jgi:hypothetical protein